MPLQPVRELASRLAQLDEASPDYWTFGGQDKRLGAHAMFHYPAMMVPQMQGAILDLIRSVEPTGNRVLDPFVGSGTTLVEAMMRGLDFEGVDINPLAILVSSAKANLVEHDELVRSCERIRARIQADQDTDYFVRFDNQHKWFSKSASIALSRIARAIEGERDQDVRRVFWVVLARVVRVVCNSRTSTYKLHAKSMPASSSESIDGLAHFASQSKVVLAALQSHARALSDAGVLKHGRYTGNIVLSVKNILDKRASNSVEADIVITSPPYGDNRTTIPYGQYSYLPLKWIPLYDIAPTLSDSLIDNTHATDTASLGGSAVRALSRGIEECGNYASYQKTIKQLSGSQDGQKRFASFAADLKKSVDVLSAATAASGFHIWTVGERRIAGKQIPMAALIQEMLEAKNITHVHSASRRILSKRMAARNTLSDTMDAEQIIIARKS